MAKSGGGRKARRNGASSPGDKMRWQGRSRSGDAAGAMGRENAEPDEATGPGATATRENPRQMRDERRMTMRDDESAERPAPPLKPTALKHLKKRSR